MLKISEIRELIRIFDETSVAELSIDTEDMKFHLKKATPVAPAVAQAPLYVQQSAAPVTETSGPSHLNHTDQSEPRIVPSVVSASEDDSLHTIKSPMVGTFYRSPTPESSAYVELGTKVKDKSVVCIIEAMKLMNEIEAEVSGEVVEIMAENGQLVEYGQPLFRIKRS